MKTAQTPASPLISGSRTRSNIDTKRYYSASDLDHDKDGQDEVPGAFPFTRGRHRTRPGNGSWIQRELSGEGSPERANEQLRY